MGSAIEAAGLSKRFGKTLALDGLDLTARIAPRLESLNLTDARGFEVDTLDVSLSDHDGALAIPRRGATVSLALDALAAAAASRLFALLDAPDQPPATVTLPSPPTTTTTTSGADPSSPDLENAVGSLLRVGHRMRDEGVVPRLGEGQLDETTLGGAAFVAGWHAPKIARLRRNILPALEPILWGKSPWRR